jgi:RHS repeat-associated protein
LDDTGLYYYGARYYDPTIGRFISADTIVPSSMNPQALNRYSYVYNNPLKYIDPTGQWGWRDVGDWFANIGKAASDLVVNAVKGVVKNRVESAIDKTNVAIAQSVYTRVTAVQVDLEQEALIEEYFLRAGRNIDATVNKTMGYIAIDVPEGDVVAKQLNDWGKWGITIPGPFGPILVYIRIEVVGSQLRMLRVHEEMHVVQSEELGHIRFDILYLLAKWAYGG